MTTVFTVLGAWFTLSVLFSFWFARVLRSVDLTARSEDHSPRRHGSRVPVRVAD